MRKEGKELKNDGMERFLKNENFQRNSRIEKL
jgi:hypothetical protein